jgi:putative membrane protein
MTYYTIVAAMTVLGFPFVILPLYFKYHTLRYHFDDQGIAMTYGILFRREVYLTYRRIQDIHVTRNFIQRWLGLASVAVQTASGSSGAEMTIEGIHEPEQLRDFLYRQMRGRMTITSRRHRIGEPAAIPARRGDDEALMLLREIRDEIRRLGGMLRGAPRPPGAGA